MYLLSYLGFKLAPICTVLSAFPASICMALASSYALKTPDIREIAELSRAVGNRRLSSHNSVAATVAVASSMISYSKFNARCVLVLG
jgi:hypothetical protein